MIAVQTEDESKQGDSRQKKKFKNLKYISVSTLADFVNGTFPEEHMEDMKYLGPVSYTHLDVYKRQVTMV